MSLLSIVHEDNRLDFSVSGVYYFQTQVLTMDKTQILNSLVLYELELSFVCFSVVNKQNTIQMTFSSEAIIAIISVVVGLPSTLLILWKLCMRRREIRDVESGMRASSSALHIDLMELGSIVFVQKFGSDCHPRRHVF